MNAPETLTPVEPALELVPIGSITPSPNAVQAARRRRFTEAGLAELADSIRAQGVLQPVLVRPTGASKFELIAGERRWLASQLAGLANIPAIVRLFDDNQVLEAQLVENLQREGVHQLEEAEGYQELIRLKRINAEQVGEMIGKSRSYVFARLKLLGLLPEAREAFYAGEMDASRALLVARIRDPKAQAKALKLATQQGWNGNPFQFSVRALQEQLQKAKATISLADAPFPLDDATLTEMCSGREIAKYQPWTGACTDCPNRTGNATDAPADSADTWDDPNVCTHVHCYDFKVRRHTERTIAQHEGQGRTILRGEEAQKILPRKDYVVGHIDLDDRCQSVPFPEPEPKATGNDEADDEAWEAYELRQEKWQPPTYRELLAKETYEAVLVEDPRTHLVRELLPLAQANVLLKKSKLRVNDYTSHATPPKQPSPQDYMAQQKEYERKREEEEARLKKERTARVALLHATWQKVKGPLTRVDLVDLADLALENYGTRNALKELHGRLPVPGEMKDAELQRLLIISTVASCIVQLHESDKGLHALAKRFKVDANAVREQALNPHAKASGTTEKKPAAKKPVKKSAAKSKTKAKEKK